MIPLRWTEQAADDLAAMRTFIARDSEAHAHIVVERLSPSAGYLREFPDLGRKVPERDQAEPRELIRQRYRTVYQHSDALIESLTSFHSSRPCPETIR